MEGVALGGLCSDSRQLLQFFDQPGHRLGITGHCVRLPESSYNVRYARPVITSPVTKLLPHSASRSAVGFLAMASCSLAPAVLSLATRSRTVASMSRYFCNCALSPSGPCPGMILVLGPASARALSLAAIMPLMLPTLLSSMKG